MYPLRTIKFPAGTFFQVFWHKFCHKNISKLVEFTPFLPRAQCDRRGAPFGQAAKPCPKGCGPLSLPRGEANTQNHRTTPPASSPLLLQPTSALRTACEDPRFYRGRLDCRMPRAFQILFRNTRPSQESKCRPASVIGPAA
jgi:hypothetical protein